MRDLRFFLLKVAFALELLLAASVAHADSAIRYCSGRWCVQPAASVGWVANLSTGELTAANVLVGGSVVREGGIPLGFGLYGGSVLSPGGAHPALASLFSVANLAAVGPGVAMLKSDGAVEYQFLAMLSLNLNHGGP